MVYYTTLKKTPHKENRMNLNLEKLIKYLEKLDKDIEKLSAQRESFKQLLIDAVEADYSSFMESDNG
jgi:hypothetical protein